jgi:hypothetical protein
MIKLVYCHILGSRYFWQTEKLGNRNNKRKMEQRKKKIEKFIKKGGGYLSIDVSAKELKYIKEKLNSPKEKPFIARTEEEERLRQLGY